jgi:hypothetical protein
MAYEAFDEMRGENRRATRLAILGIATTIGVWLPQAPWWVVASFAAITLLLTELNMFHRGTPSPSNVSEDDEDLVLKMLGEIQAFIDAGRRRSLIVPIVLLGVVWLAGAPWWTLLALVALALFLNVERWSS